MGTSQLPGEWTIIMQVGGAAEQGVLRISDDGFQTVTNPVVDRSTSTVDSSFRHLAHLLLVERDMKRDSSRATYRVEELVGAAYRAAVQETSNRMLAAILASKILEDWLTNSDRPDLLKQLETSS